MVQVRRSSRRGAVHGVAIVADQFAKSWLSVTPLTYTAASYTRQHRAMSSWGDHMPTCNHHRQAASRTLIERVAISAASDCNMIEQLEQQRKAQGARTALHAVSWAWGHSTSQGQPMACSAAAIAAPNLPPQPNQVVQYIGVHAGCAGCTEVLLHCWRALCSLLPVMCRSLSRGPQPAVNPVQPVPICHAT
jgi:hypothetical protein